MSINREYLHQGYLNRLCKYNNLRQIDENPDQIRAIIKEPTYERIGWRGNMECPDLFLGYDDHTWTVIELKHTREKRDKAFSQIESGIEMLVDVFGIPLKDITGKFVIYTPDKYMWERYK